MPLVDGFAATRMIREREASRPSARHTPIVALTAQVLAGDRERCLESGMDDYCPKPVDAHALARILNRWGARVDRATPDV
ncbi:MAG: response regulator, partial [Planctomycetes bacterium]|nr:response regulator [Planctomycetota bacterium]